jgi:hypothetical protein
MGKGSQANRRKGDQLSTTVCGCTCQKYHNLAKKGFYASVGELGDDMRQEN